MSLRYLDHVNIRTADLARLKRFYCEVIGLEDGPRPDFPFGGAWLYCGELAPVHLIEVDEQPDGASPSLEHFAFAGDDRAAFVARLEAENWPYRSVMVPGVPLEQIRLEDPDGNRFHVDFPTA